jgi:hypothetical protein
MPILNDTGVAVVGIAAATALAVVIVLRAELFGFIRRYHATLADVSAVLAVVAVLAYAPFIAKGSTGLTFECQSAPIVLPPTRGAVICEANLQQLAIRLGLVLAVWAVIRFRKFR